MKDIFFVSKNKNKIKEVLKFFKTFVPAVAVIKAYELEINEIQSEKLDDIAKDKVLKAFDLVRRPLFVEHTGLYIKNFGDLPGGLTQIVWDALKGEKFCEYFGKGNDTTAEARTVIAYCDGKTIELFKGTIRGKIADSPSRDDTEFEWDCAFIPDGYTQTFAQLKEKQEISMRKRALTNFVNYLKSKQ